MTRRLPSLFLAGVIVLLTPSALLAGAFPGQNGRIVFDLGSRLYTVNPDGSGLTPITPAGFYTGEPTWAPDGNRIAFTKVCCGGAGYGIWVINADGTGAHQVTSEPQSVAGEDHDPTWSPDGSKIAFVRENDLLVMNADGSGGSTNLTSTFAGPVETPEWSPAGDRFAFRANGDIYVMNADGSGVSPPLTAQGPQDFSPSWSPDGSRIAYGFSSGVDAGEVRAMNPDGTNNVGLVGGLRELWAVAWSPDGSKIAYINDAGNAPFQEELFTINADGTSVTRLSVATGIRADWGVLSTLAPPPPADGPAGSPPVLGKTVNVEPSGKVFVSVPTGAARTAASVPGLKGREFVPLTESRQIPVKSLLDTRKGKVRVTSATTRAGKTQSGVFSSGVFQVLQSRKQKAKGLTELQLKGSTGEFKRCTSANRNADAARLSRRAIRRLRARARGRYRIGGRYSAATIRGTIWTVADRCDGTLTTVKRGEVAVRDFRRKKTILLTPGKSYLARAPG